jgi:hypothetical protein
MSGTTFAAPHVADVAALELARGGTLMLNGGLIAASGAPQPTATPDTPTPETVIQPTIEDDSFGTRPSIPRLSSVLDELRRSYGENAAQALQEGELSGLEIQGDRVQVNLIMLDEASANAAVQTIPSLGGEVTAHYNVWIDAWIPIPQLEPLVYLPGVTLVQPVVPVYPVDNPALQAGNVTPLVGSQTSQGVEFSNADEWHALGYQGAGISIAIIDVGFLNYTVAQGTDDLPDSIDCYPDVDCSTLSMGTNHGTAVAEIVHDMAPLARPLP